MKVKWLLTALLGASVCFFSINSNIQASSDSAASKFLTQNQIDQIFGPLPRCLDLGSFVINRLNNTPKLYLQDTFLYTQDSQGNYYRTRPNYETFKNHIQKTLTASQGDWSIYVKDLTADRVLSINEHPMESASLIKLFIAGAALERIENGTLSETDTISSALHDMITVSDNEASNVLVRSFYSAEEGKTFQDGLDIVNDFARRYGFLNTSQVNGIADPDLWVSDGNVNETSCADCGKFLELVYNRELVSHYASYRLEYLLNSQQVNYKIPRSLPEDVHIAHKTGEVDDTENDAAIIYTPRGDLILCIMATDLEDKDAAVDTIRNISRYVYDWHSSPLAVIDAQTYEAEYAAELH